MTDAVTRGTRTPARARRVALALKRALDLAIATGALLVQSPLVALIALAIKLDDGGPILFVQDRVGRGGRVFPCRKFRTMRVGAGDGAGEAVAADDPRITRVGRVLRLWTLDEIPQLWNVLKGDMSIVGPRPWIPRQAERCAGWARPRFDLRPGLAGWAWIHGRNLVPWEDRVRMDVWYVNNWSLALDAYILAKAFVLLFQRRGVYGQAAMARDPDLE